MTSEHESPHLQESGKEVTVGKPAFIDAIPTIVLLTVFIQWPTQALRVIGLSSP